MASYQQCKYDQKRLIASIFDDRMYWICFIFLYFVVFKDGRPRIVSRRWNLTLSLPCESLHLSFYLDLCNLFISFCTKYRERRNNGNRFYSWKNFRRNFLFMSLMQFHNFFISCHTKSMTVLILFPRAWVLTKTRHFQSVWHSEAMTYDRPVLSDCFLLSI